MTKQERLEQLKKERVRLKRILATDSPMGAESKSRIENQLSVTEASITTIQTEIEAEALSPAKRELTAVEVEHVEAVIRNQTTLIVTYSDITVEGRLSKPARRLTAAAAEFMEMHHEVYQTVSHAFEAGKTDVVTVDTFAELFRVVLDHQRIALVGDPGAGKTTTMRKLAHHVAEIALEERTGPIPIFVDLSVRGHRLEDLIQKSAPQLVISSYAPRDLIVFFDALNEASREIVDDLVDWLALSRERRAVVSCRKLDYFDRKLPLRRVDLLPLNVRQIHNFVSRFFEDPRDIESLFWTLAGQDASAAWRWYRKSSGIQYPSFENFWEGDIGHAYPYEIEKHKISQLQAEARDKIYPGVLDVVTNPFLLFIAMMIFMSNNAPPKSRGKFFEQFATLMLDRGGWLDVAPSPPRPVTTKVEVTRLLAHVAHQMILDSQGTGVTEAWLREFISTHIKGADADEFIIALKRSGILEWRGGQLDSVKFRHQLLQEYFASLHMATLIAQGATARQFWPNDTWWEHSAWDEVMILLVDLARDPSPLVRWLAPTNPSLAYRCVSERGGECSDELLSIILSDGGTSRICPIAKADWGRRLARMGDRRPGVGIAADGLPDIEWVSIPPGPFKMGGGHSILKNLGLFVSEREIPLPYPYFISKYPVTYRQFECFVADGYRDDKYWTAAGLAWRGDQAAPRLWNDANSNLPNHPVVGVTWFEALAFTRWLDAKRHAAAMHHADFPAGWEITLPTEAEWEKAARFPDGRRFPWGNDYRPGAANIDETFQGAVCGPYSLRRTTAVGMYEGGASALGVYDLCGNVWEWCLSKWDVEYHDPEDIGTDGNVHRAVRGGSWYNSVAFAESSAHDCHDSDLGVKDVGFRLVIRPRVGIPNADG